MDRSFLRKLIPVLVSNSVCWLYALVYVPLAFVFNDFPGQDNLVVLIATIPALVCMFAGIAAAPLMSRFNKKTVVMIGLVFSILGGLIVRVFGTQSIWICILGSGFLGIPAGLIAAANYAVLAEISPENMRDKVCGWGDACCSIGMTVATLLAGFLCADGNWVRAYDVCFISVLILVFVAFAYPSVPPASEKEPDASDVVVEEAASSKFWKVLPMAVLGMIFIKFITGCFYMVTTLNVSEFVINEGQLGGSELAGFATTAFSFVAMFSGLLVFAWIKFTKGFSITACLLVYAVLLFLVPRSTSPVMLIVLMGLTGFFEVMNYSTASTLVTMSAPARSVELATSLFVTASFVGEFLGGYVPRFLAQLIFGNTLASSCYIIGAVGLVVIALIALPFCKQAYAVAFGDERAE